MWSRGSEWHKWDLHVHVPGTTYANQYSAGDEDEFCDVIAASDVAAVGITDYFTLERCFALIDRYKARHPQSAKLLIPNLEVRVAAGGENPKADAHVLFSPELDWAAIRSMLARVSCRHSDQSGSKPGHLSDFASKPVPAGLHVPDLATMVRELGPANPGDLLVVVPAGKDGFTFASPSALIKAKSAALRDWAHGAFGNPTDEARHAKQREQGGPWKGPVFAGSDSHSMADLKTRLGQSIQGSARDSHITWIKAAITWDGLWQTVADPDNRVSLSPTRPEFRRPGQIIDAIEFGQGSVYPAGLMPLNQGLVAIVGSRSSGKSSLLAQIARAARPAMCSERLLKARKHDGPCAGIQWRAADDCTVSWGDGRASSRGELVYFPQDFIHQTSTDSQTVTDRLLAAALQQDGELGPKWEQFENSVDGSVRSIEVEVRGLFGDRLRGEELASRLAERESQESLSAAVAEAEARRQSLDRQFELSADQKALLATFRADETRLREMKDVLEDSQRRLADACSGDPAAVSEFLRVDIELLGIRLEKVPPPLAAALSEAVEESTTELASHLANKIDAQRSIWTAELARVEAEIAAATVQAQSVLDIVAASKTETARIDAELEALHALARDRAVDEALLAEVLTRVGSRYSQIEAVLRARRGKAEALRDHVNSLELRIGDVTVTAEIAFLAADYVSAADPLDGRSSSKSRFVKIDGGLDIDKAQENIRAFVDEVTSLAAGSLRLRTNQEAAAFVVRVLGSSPRVHLVGELDGDRIGGSSAGSMSPGKSAQFAFELLMAGAPPDCPILLDQPEDDLDSGSIMSSLLPRIRQLRATRQVLIATHNANLVVGGDADQIVVAERKLGTSGEHELSYSAGPLEQEAGTTDVDIRSSVCTLLDGGVDAMERRLAQYRINGTG